MRPAILLRLGVFLFSPNPINWISFATASAQVDRVDVVDAALSSGSLAELARHAKGDRTSGDEHERRIRRNLGKGGPHRTRGVGILLGPFTMSISSFRSAHRDNLVMRFLLTQFSRIAHRPRLRFCRLAYSRSVKPPSSSKAFACASS